MSGEGGQDVESGATLTEVVFTSLLSNYPGALTAPPPPSGFGEPGLNTYQRRDVIWKRAADM